VQVIYARQALTEHGWETDVAITIDATGTIVDVVADVAAVGKPMDLVLPAPANLHSHSFQRGMAGLTEQRGPDASDSFWTWRRLMYRFLDQLTPDDVEAIAALAFMEMAEAGFGHVVEFHYLHHGPDGAIHENPAEMSDRIVSAAGRVGIGLTLLPVHYQFGGCDGRELSGGQVRFGNDPDLYARIHEAARTSVASLGNQANIGTAAHSLRAVNKAGLDMCDALGRHGPIHIHAAEQVAEVEEVQAHLGARPVEWLLANRDIDARWCLIHCTQMTAAEVEELAQSGAVAGLCPITEANLGDGIFAGTDFLNERGHFGIGTDSNVQISLFAELRALEYSQRLRDRNRSALATQSVSTGRNLFGQALKGGARASARNTGQLAAGFVADLVGIETDNVTLCDRTGDTVLDSLIFGANGTQCITDMWSGGRHIVSGRRHDKRQEIEAAYRRAIARLTSAI